MVTLSCPSANPAFRLLRKAFSPQGLLTVMAGLALALTGCGSGGTVAAPTPTAAAPVFSPAGGTYAAAQSVSISDSTTGASIYYTLDGSAPTTSSTKYTAAVTVSATETVSAIAVATGDNNSPVTSAVYTILPPPAAAPTFSPAAGAYNSIQTVSLADATAGSVIYYTTDGSAPTVNSAKYAAPLTISATTTVNAIAVATGFSNSAVASATYTITLPAAATPVFSPAPGTFTSVQTVALSDATAGAPIYYTIDGTTPTTASMRYTTPIAVNSTTTINAIAGAVTGYNNSAVASGTFTINLPPAATPTFSPAAGTYTTVQTVSLADSSANAVIYYTTDGTTPTTASMRYTTPIAVNSTTTIKAIATATNFTTSAVASGTFTINFPPAATPTFSPAAGTYTTVQTVSIADATAGATIYYTTDGTVPTTASMKYVGAITVGTTETINAIATATGNVTSAVGSATYTINFPPAATPTFSPAAGTYTSAQTVSISDATAGATIYYTLDGSAPTTASMKYVGAITVGTTETINAIATATGNVTSAVGSATYTINLPAAATPTFSTAAGTFTSAQTVSIADSTAGATIYYTLDGSAPTTASMKYTGAISVASTETINAIATASGFNQSAVASATYTINQPTAATPVFSPVAGTYTTYQTVSISDTTTGATIYYTLDGSTPTAASAKYTTPISVTVSETINAIAIATGNNNSAIASAKYVINLQPAATPAFTPAPATYTTIQTVTIADTTTGATIYYTLDGSAPTTSSTKYTGPITVSVSETINAIATATGFLQSAVGTGAYTINLPTAATPTFTPPAGAYSTSQSVTISDATAGTVIYYTTDGSTPTTASAVYSTPIVVSATETLKAIATETGYLQSAVGTAAYTFTVANPTVAVTLSTYNSSALLAAQAPVTFTTSTPSTTVDQLIIDENTQFQTVDGFGASFTDASAYNLEQVELPSMLQSTLSDLFTRTGAGIGLSFMRTPFGATDESKSIYSYDDSASADPTLANFSISHDLSYIIPLIQAAKTLNPSLKQVASPWSPPAWMKTPVSLEGGTLNSAYYTPFANYLIKSLTAYQSNGILPDYLTIQNEPLNNTTGYPSLYIDAPTALTLTRDYVMPALSSSGLTTKLLVYDHNWDNFNYPYSVLTDPTVMASPLVAGTAWHGYAGTPGVQLTLSNNYPTKGDWETEHSGGTFINGGTATGQFINDLDEITLVMRGSSKGYIKWNLALDQNRGPNTSTIANPAGGKFGGCNTCEGIVTINSNTGAPTKTIEYYTIGQYSKFILPGATHVWSSNTPYVVSSAYINPDGTRVLVASNNSFGSTTFQVVWGGQNFSYTLSAYATATFVWSGTQNGTALQSAKAQIQGDNFVTGTGMEMEYTTDDTGSYDIGYVTNGSTMYYKNVDFGTGVSTVSVRVANTATGGTANFYLDSPTGTLLATVPIANTGGYQTWQTTTIPVSSTATGKHDLYMVLKGSGSIGNVNFFQFQ